MEKEKRKRDENALHIFKPSPILRAAYVLGSFAFFGLLGISGYALSTQPLTIGEITIAFLCATMGIFGIQNEWARMRESIALYEDGIEHRIGSRRMFASWDELYQFKWHYHGRYGFLGIDARSPLTVHSSRNLIERFLPFQWGRYTIRIPDINGINTRFDGCWGKRSINFEHLKKSEFGQIVYEYAPHLFNKAEKTKY